MPTHLISKTSNKLRLLWKHPKTLQIFKPLPSTIGQLTQKITQNISIPHHQN